MFRNYIKIALRNLQKDKLHTIINTVGLSLGIACCILILLFVQNELSFDRFHSKSDRIYRAWVMEDYENGNQFFNTVTPFPLAPALKTEVPEIESVVPISILNWQAVKGDKKYNERVHMVGPTFFELFDFEIIAGNSDMALSDVKNIVLTKDTAIKYFGSTEVIGRTIEFNLEDGRRTCEVATVVENPPSNSSIGFDMLISDLNKDLLLESVELDNWFNVSAETYVLLKKDVNVAGIEPKLAHISEKYVGMPSDDGTYHIGLQPLTDIHLNPEFPVGIAQVSDPKYAYILGGIALLILIIACINFIMLSISKSVGRAKEVGVRKSIGASRLQIAQQFLSEAILTVCIGLLFGLLLARLFLSKFNQLANKALEMGLTPFLLLVSLGLVIIIGVIAGSYPAFVVSNFKSATILKGGNTGQVQNSTLRRILIGVQFALSIGLIASTLIMRDQLNYLQNRNLGFDKEQLVSVPLHVPEGRIGATIQKGMEIAQLYKTKLKSFPEIKSVSASSHSFSTDGWTELGYSDLDGRYHEFDMNVVSPEYISTMAMEIVKGRDFQEGNVSDRQRAVIVNEAFAEAFNIADLNGAEIEGSPFGEHEIIGVVKDFNYSSLHGKIRPLALTLNPMVFFTDNININFYSDPTPKLFVRLQGGNVSEGLEILEKIWSEISQDETFEFQFVDEQINAMYQQERNLGTIVGIAALFTILVGSLGLFALVSLNIQNRMKELSIRSILGASEGIRLYLISKEYLFMLLGALAISAPVVWYVMDNWLAGFAYRTPLSLTFFLWAGFIAFISASISIGYHAHKAVKTSPVEYLGNQ